MKKIISVIISLILAAASVSLFVSADESDIFTYTVSGDEATITGINHEGYKDIAIPETIDGYTVTKINKIETVFDFGTDNMVESLYIPETVTGISSNALGYFDCAKFEVDEDNQYYSSDEHGVLFNKDKTALVRMPCSFQESSYTIPESVTEIYSYALEACVFLQHIDFPSRITSINIQTCMQMISLESVEIPEGVTLINQNAFAQCYSLTEVTLPSTLTALYNGAFTECPEIKEIIIPDNVTEIQQYAFESDSALRTVTIPAGLKTTGYGVFQNCSSLKDICFTGTEEEFAAISIGTSNTPFTSADIHYNFDKSEYENIEYNISDGILSVTGTGKILSSGENDWHYWDSYKDEVITIITGSDITEIGDYAFDGFEKLELFVPGSDNLTIGGYAFGSCTSLDNIVAYGNLEFSENSIPDGTRVFICGSAAGIDSGSIINYSIENNTLHFDNYAEFDKYDFFDIIAVICNYGEFDKITFSDIQFSDIDLYYLSGYSDGNPEYEKADDNRLTNGEITVKLSENSESISFNTLTEKLNDGTISSFILVITDENHPDISDIPIDVEPDDSEDPDKTDPDNDAPVLQFFRKTYETLVKGIKWAVTLLNKLFKYVRKK